MTPLDTILFESDLVRVGKFRCAVSHRSFHDSGPTEGHIVVFPRTAVWIRHAGARAFLADPQLATIYNRAQEYTREVASADGDRSDWFAVSPSLASEIAREVDPASPDDSDRPFVAQYAAVDHRLYFRQRELLSALERHGMDRLEAEERVIAIVAGVIGASVAGIGVRRYAPPRRTARDAHRQLAEHARAVIASDLSATASVASLGRVLGVSPFHLCRVFRRETGLTLHEYRTQIRIRVALEQLADSARDVSQIAHDLGFSSHSHFSATISRFFHTSPTDARVRLRAT